MLSRVLIKKQSGRRPLTALAVMGLLGSMLLAGGTAFAVHEEGLFELDTTTDAAICAPLSAPCGNANTANDAAVPGEDWDGVFADSDTDTSFISDNVGSAENSYYTGGGSKDVRPISAWAYGTANDPVPDKDDIADIFAAQYTDADDHTVIYFGMDRYDNNGDAESGFWFFKSPVSLDGNGGFTGEHTIGDVLVLANWGGSNPVGELTVYDWVGGRNPLRLLADNLVADCAVAEDNDNYCAVVNRESVTPAWDFEDKAGSTSIRPLELLEGGIDVFDLTGANTCFTSFLGATRSSHSTTAQLKDFVIGPFEECGASLTTNANDADKTITLGQSITDTATIHVTGSGTPPAPTGDVTFTISFEGGAAQAVSVESLTGVVPVGDNYSVTSDAFTPDAVGEWCFSASWPGDTVYTGGPYVDDQVNECFDVVSIPTSISTAQKWTPNDSATISTTGPAGFNLTGTVLFQLYGPNDTTCAGTVRYQESITLPANAGLTETVSTTNGDGAPATGVGADFFVTAANEGTYSWKVTYTSGDTGHDGSSSACSVERTLVDITQP